MRRRRLREVVAAELRRVRSGRTQRVACDLARRVRDRANLERRLEHLPDCVVPGARRELGQPLDDRTRDGVPRGVEPCEIGPFVAARESLRAHAEHGGSRRQRFRVLGIGEPVRRGPGRRPEKRQKPVQLVGNRGERGGRSGGTGRAVLGAEEAPPESVDCLAREASAFGELLAVGVQHVRDRAQSFGGRVMTIGLPARRPEKHDRAHPGADCEAPALEPVRDRGVRRRNRHREDEREDRSGRRRCEVAAEHAGEEDDEADNRHRARSEPWAPRAERPERDEESADEPQPGVGGQPLPRRARRSRPARARRTSQRPRGARSAAAGLPCPRARRPPG